MKEYLLISGDELMEFPPVLFINDGEKISAYSSVEQSKKRWQSYVDAQEDPTMEKLASRFTYANTDFGPIDKKKQRELDQIIESMSSKEKPITAASPGDEAWRRIKAQLQRRDRYGRFAEMGGGFSFVFKGADGSMSRITGKITGQSGTDNVDVEVKGSNVLPDGVYSIPSHKGEAVKAVISLDGLEDAGVDKDKADEVFPADTPFVSMGETSAPEAPEAPKNIAQSEPIRDVKDLKDSVSKFKPEQLQGAETKDAMEQFVSDVVDTYEINGERVAFLNPDITDIDTSGVKVMRVNPYEISGKSLDSKEGQDIAEKWFYARTAVQSMSTPGSSDVEALLYAGVNGDEESMSRFEQLAENGKELIEKARQQLKESSAPSDYDKMLVNRRFAQTGGEPKPEDLFMVRQVQFTPEYDENGNLTMYPAGNYDIEDNGTTVRYPRSTVHFTLNHPVEQHAMWQPGENDYIVVTPFTEFMSANPDSIDNLYAIDTFATPKPGQPLTLPKGSFKVIKADKDAEQRKKDVAEAIKEMGGTYAFRGGSHFSDEEGTDRGVQMIAEELGLNPGMIHASHATGMYERDLFDVMYKSPNRRIQPDWGPYQARDLSRNAMLTLAAMSVWSGVGQNTRPDPDAFAAF